MTAVSRAPETPVPSGILEHDAAAVREHSAAGEEVLAGLPAKPDRTPGQQRTADEVHRSCRRLRAGFLRLHVERVYDRLTDGRTTPLRVAGLALRAAEVFPGLVPGERQLAAEGDRVQSAKEGREIDQGLFFREVLRSPVAGRHLLDSMLRPTSRAEALLPEFRRTGDLDLGTVRITRQGDAAHLTIGNTRYLNAEDNELTEDMETAVDLTLLDDRVRVGVLRGGVMTHPRYQGKRVFSAGINLTKLHDGRISFTDFLLRRELGYLAKLARGLHLGENSPDWPLDTLAKPWLAAVDSFAIGGGAQLLLVFDHVIAAADAYFSLPAAQEGIVPGAANLRLPRQTGPRLARQVILGGRKIWAAEPEAATVFDTVADPREMDQAIAAEADRLTSPAVVANRRMLNLAEEPPDTFRAYLAEFAIEQALRLNSADVLAKVGKAWARH